MSDALSQCFHQDIEWNYSGCFAVCRRCNATFADATYLEVRAGAGRTRWVVRSVVPMPAMRDAAAAH
jgi:hypothetical protein